MSTSVGLQELREVREPPLSKPLDEATWQAWVEKGGAQDRRSSAARMNTVKWASIVGLLAAVGLWSHVTPYEAVVRFIVAAGAMVVMFQAFHARHYGFATVLGSSCAPLQPGSARVQFFGRLAARCRGSKHRPVRRVTRLAPCKDGTQ
jgi:hypothetical protein